MTGTPCPTPLLSIILPRYHEGVGVVRETLHRLERGRASGRAQVVVVNDAGSRDPVDALAAEFPDVIFLNNEKNLGKAMSIARGLGHARGKYVFFSDIDLPVDHEPLFERIENADKKPIRMVVGRRVKTGSGQTNTYRRMTSAAFRALFHVCITDTIWDSQCPWKLFDADLARSLFASLRTRSFAFDAELIYRALQRQELVEEIPICWHDTRAPWGAGKSLSVFLAMIFDLVTIRFRCLERGLTW